MRWCHALAPSPMLRLAATAAVPVGLAVHWSEERVPKPWQSVLCSPARRPTTPTREQPSPQVPTVIAEPRKCGNAHIADPREVVSKQWALSLPPFCAIDLLPSAPLPSSGLEHLSRPEREAMESYITESLALGLIVPPSSLWKRDSSLFRKKMGPSGPALTTEV